MRRLVIDASAFVTWLGGNPGGRDSDDGEILRVAATVAQRAIMVVP